MLVGYKLNILFGRLAHLAEHNPDKIGVSGSNPLSTTKFLNIPHYCKGKHCSPVTRTERVRVSYGGPFNDNMLI